MTWAQITNEHEAQANNRLVQKIELRKSAQQADVDAIFDRAKREFERWS